MAAYSILHTTMQPNFIVHSLCLARVLDMPDVGPAGDRTRPWVGDGPALVSVAEVTSPLPLIRADLLRVRQGAVAAQVQIAALPAAAFHLVKKPAVLC